MTGSLDDVQALLEGLDTRALRAVADAQDAQVAAIRAAVADLRAAVPPPWDLGPVRALVAVRDAKDWADASAGPPPLPGTHLCLAPGEYATSLAVPRSWTGVVVRSGSFFADAPQAAVVTGNILVQGPGCVAAGFLCTNATADPKIGASIVLAAPRARATRNVVDTPPLWANGIDATASDVAIDANEVRQFANNGLCPKPGTQRVYVGQNYLHGRVDGGRPLSQAGMMIGGLISGVTENPGFHVIEGNLLEDWVGVDGLELKSSDCVLRGNTLIGSAAGQCSINVRHGPRTLIAGNWVENGSVQLGDNDSVAVCNKTTGTRNSPGLKIKAGTCSPEEFLASGGGAGKYPFARNARVVAHDGAIVVGFRANGVETLVPLGTVIEACAGSVAAIAGASYSRSDVSTWTGEQPTPRRLTPADVGPGAPPRG